MIYQFNKKTLHNLGSFFSKNSINQKKAEVTIRPKINAKRVFLSINILKSTYSNV